MKKVLLLEDSDERVRKLEFWLPTYLQERVQLYVAASVRKAQDLFREHKPFDLILLDHDLDGRVFVESSEFNTGARFARWLSDPARAEDIAPSQIIIHSMNPVGAENIRLELQLARVPSQKVPFPILLDLLSSRK